MENFGGEKLRIDIVLASSRDWDREMLEESLSGTPWRLVLASNLPQAIEALRHVTVPIVLCDGWFDNVPWQLLLRALRRERRRVCVILLAGPGPVEVWSELARRGGFDVLTRPFRREEVFPTLVSAYAHCRVSSPLARTLHRDAVPTA